LTSQRSGQKGGFKAQERAVESATGLTDDGKTIEETRFGLTHNLGGFPAMNVCSISVVGKYGG